MNYEYLHISEQSETNYSGQHGKKKRKEISSNETEMVSNDNESNDGVCGKI